MITYYTLKMVHAGDLADKLNSLSYDGYTIVSVLPQETNQNGVGFFLIIYCQEDGVDQLLMEQYSPSDV